MSSGKPVGESDFSKFGMGGSNLFVVYSSFWLLSYVPGFVGGVVALKRSEGVAAKVSTIAAEGAGPMYLAWTFLKYSTLLIQANLSTVRRPTGVNAPDQHVYQVKGGPADGAVVLMDDSSSLFGPFNRAQRALQNFGEVMPAAVGDFVLAGQVFPMTSSVLLLAFSLCRVKGALAYTEERTKRMVGNFSSMFFTGGMGGLIFAVGARATYLQLRR